MAAGLEPRGDRWRLPCEGLVVGQVRVDYAFGLELTETPERAAEVAWQLRINTPFTLTSSSGSRHDLDPEGPAEQLAPAMVARHQQLIEGNVWADRRLALAFADGTVIRVEPDPEYEAWGMVPDPIDGFPFSLFAPIAPDRVDWG